MAKTRRTKSIEGIHEQVARIMRNPRLTRDRWERTVRTGSAYIKNIQGTPQYRADLDRDVRDGLVSESRRTRGYTIDEYTGQQASGSGTAARGGSVT